jgi:lipopolysaccharide transport system ATP-binding protein
MSDTVISIKDIGKAYRIGLAAEKFPTFRDALMGIIRSPIDRFRKLGEYGTEADTFWALRNISFNVKRGEVVGIIGRNGAGKSTLLKILSRITEPTEGEIRMRGRVASLLEVGTGFHPELTGRENIYLNGAILGMRRHEITRKFDEIVAFSEVEKFVDTPVKRYSSGMYVRLAFAVAAHLEPEVLIVDEVLAVGDVAFQQKCLGKMKDVASGQGRTVLFVSHNMAAIRSLCQSCCVLDRGQLVQRGDVHSCTISYLQKLMEMKLAPTVHFSRPTGAPAWMTSATLLTNGRPSAALPMGGELSIEINFRAEPAMQRPAIGFIIWTVQGERVINVNNKYQLSEPFDEPVTEGRIRCDLGQLPLAGGRYSIWLYFGNQLHDSHRVENALSFEVIEQDIWGGGKVPQSDTAPLWWPTRFSMLPAAQREADPVMANGHQQ